MSMMHFDPERELLSLGDVMKYLVDESLVSSSGVAIEVITTPENLVVQVSLPDIQPEDLKITLQGELLTIASPASMRSLTLPCPVESEKTQATFERGVLTVTLPKAGEAKLYAIKLQEK